LLLGNRRLALLVGPIAADCSRSKPFSIHGTERPFGIGAVPESDESIAARPPSLHVPHDASFGYRPEGGESLQQYLVVDFVRKITNEDMEVIRSILLRSIVGLISPVDADFL
jgi:hypothetical protein